MDKYITQIEKKDKKANIYINDEYFGFVYISDLRKRLLKTILIEGSIEEKNIDILTKFIVNRGKKYIMYLLAKQDYASLKLIQKLETKGYIKEHAKLIIEPFISKKYVNDNALINRKVNNYKRCKSKKEILYNLKNKGFEDSKIKENLNLEYTDEQEFNVAVDLLLKKFTNKKDKLDEKTLKNKAIGFLARKGFPSSICFKAFEVFIENK